MAAPETQSAVEESWLDLTHRITASDDGSCLCWPSAAGARWSGYLGANYNETRVLFVGANHNGGETGLLKTPRMGLYNQRLALWSSIPRSPDGDRDVLDTMRDVYASSWPYWGAVWKIFSDIRKRVGILDDAFAFVNLARCPSPQDGDAWNDSAVTKCQRCFPLADLVDAIDARVIFLAKGGDVGGAVRIPGEIELRELTEPFDVSRRLVIRYDNGLYGYRRANGAPEHRKTWVPIEAPRIRSFLDVRGGGASTCHSSDLTS